MLEKTVFLINIHFFLHTETKKCVINDESLDEGSSRSVLRANKIPSEVVVLVTVLR